MDTRVEKPSIVYRRKVRWTIEFLSGGATVQEAQFFRPDGPPQGIGFGSIEYPESVRAWLSVPSDWKPPTFDTALVKAYDACGKLLVEWRLGEIEAAGWDVLPPIPDDDYTDAEADLVYHWWERKEHVSGVELDAVLEWRPERGD